MAVFILEFIGMLLTLVTFNSCCLACCASLTHRLGHVGEYVLFSNLKSNGWVLGFFRTHKKDSLCFPFYSFRQLTFHFLHLPTSIHLFFSLSSQLDAFCFLLDSFPFSFVKLCRFYMLVGSPQILSVLSRLVPFC